MGRPRKIKEPQVLIVGAGPAGSAFAHVLAKAGLKVLMVDAGPQLSDRPGRVVKNTFAYQRDLNQFSYMIQGFLHPLSVPPGIGVSGDEIDPIAWRPHGGPYNPIRFSDRGPINPRQDPDKNLGSEAVAFGVGGMMQHWTAATPRHNPDLELYKFAWKNSKQNQAIWDELYGAGEKLLRTNQDAFKNSIRHKLVLKAIKEHYLLNPQFAPPPEYPVQALPMAVTRSTDPRNNEFVSYTGTDTILADVIDDPELRENLEILPESRVKLLVKAGDAIDHAVIEDLMEGDAYEVHAGVYVVASGAVMSANILWRSGIALDTVGRYIIEHPIAFTQVILRQDLIDKVKSDPDWDSLWDAQKRRTQKALEENENSATSRREPPRDVLPIPMDDAPPNVWIPVSKDRPWHCQIHKDAFHYGALPAGIDDRLIVDLRWFSIIEPRASNRVEFETDRWTSFGTAQPTFHFTLSDEERQRMHTMMEDMVGVASSLGAFLPGSEPKFMPKGLALHIQGTTRMGSNPASSVVDEHLKVHEISNLYVGGNGVISTPNAANPTLTSVALALRAAEKIARDFRRADRNMA
jgi:pyranose oxidase